MATRSSIISLIIRLFIFASLFYLYSSCQKELSCENCIAINKLPVAKAGANQTIQLPKDSTLLDGTNSNDPDGTIRNYLWKKISGPSSFLINDANAGATIFKNLVVGVYLLELKVTDNSGGSALDTVEIEVINGPTGNRPPVAVAGPDQTINLPNNTVILDGLNSTDPDNNIVSYEWTRILGPGTFLFSNLTLTQVTANFLVAGIHLFELKVTDAGGLYSKDTVQITVQ